MHFYFVSVCARILHVYFNNHTYKAVGFDRLLYNKKYDLATQFKILNTSTAKM